MPIYIETSICPECGAAWTDGRTCQEFFHQMLFWENEQPALGEVHHLMVLCYHLQHPSLYSAEGLRHARQLLADFVEGGVTPEEARRRSRKAVDSGKREWAIKARSGNRGSYGRSVEWVMTVEDVVQGGINQYVGNIQNWATSLYSTLKALSVDE